jgi:hypothetical protein
VVHHGRLGEAEARRYFQQLIDDVDYWHSKGLPQRFKCVVLLTSIELLFSFFFAGIL